MEYGHLVEVHWHTALQLGGSCWAITLMSGRLGLADGDANSRRAPKALQHVSEEAARYSGKKLSVKSIEGFSQLSAHRRCIATYEHSSRNFLSCVTWFPLSIYFPLFWRDTRFWSYCNHSVLFSGPSSCGSRWREQAKPSRSSCSLGPARSGAPVVCRWRSGPAGARGAGWSPVRAGVPRLEWAKGSMPETVWWREWIILQPVTEESPTSETHSATFRAFGIGHLSSFVTASLLSLSTIESVFCRKTRFCVRWSSWSGGPREPSGTPSVWGILAGVVGTCV